MIIHSYGEFEAVERAGRMFDELVARYLSGAAACVEIDWVDAPTPDWDVDGMQYQEPNVTVDGKPAEHYYLDIVATEDLKASDDDKVSGAVSFSEMLGGMWESTISEINELDAEVQSLAGSREYLDRVAENSSAEGLGDLLGADQAMIQRIARDYVVADLRAYVDAIYAQEV